MNSYIKKILSFIDDALFTVKCPYCGRVIKRSEYACDICKTKFPQTAFTNYAVGGYETVSPFPYNTVFAKAVKRFKFRNNPKLSKQLAFPLSAEILKAFDISKIDLITCVPMHRKTLRQRGYNQAELLAKECAEILQIEYLDTLEKFKENKFQHQLSGDKRAANVRGVYRVPDKSTVKDKNILIIDDIITTGNTLGECCRILKKSDCGNLYCATLCVVI